LAFADRSDVLPRRQTRIVAVPVEPRTKRGELYWDERAHLFAIEERLAGEQNADPVAAARADALDLDVGHHALLWFCLSFTHRSLLLVCGVLPAPRAYCVSDLVIHSRTARAA